MTQLRSRLSRNLSKLETDDVTIKSIGSLFASRVKLDVDSRLKCITFRVSFNKVYVELKNKNAENLEKLEPWKNRNILRNSEQDVICICH